MCCFVNLLLEVSNVSMTCRFFNPFVDLHYSEYEIQIGYSHSREFEVK